MTWRIFLSFSATRFRSSGVFWKAFLLAVFPKRRASEKMGKAAEVYFFRFCVVPGTHPAIVTPLRSVVRAATSLTTANGLLGGFGEIGFFLFARIACAPLTSRPARARPPNAPVPRAATSPIIGAVRTPPSPAERSKEDKRRRLASRAGARLELKHKGGGTGVEFFNRGTYTGVHRGTYGYTGVHRATQGYTGVQRSAQAETL